MLQYQQVPEDDYSQGIDARSSENQIQPGFVRDLLNANIVKKRARKRTGYQGYAGSLPIRAVAMQYKAATQEVCFTLDSAVSLDSTVNLETVRSSPLVVYGRSSTFSPGDGPFDTDGDSVKYYPGFHIPNRKEFIAPSGTLNVAGDEHGLGTTDMLVGISESTSLVDRSHQIILADAVRINESSFDINIDYVTAVNRNVYVYFSDNSSFPGQTYNQAFLAVTPGTHTFTVTAGTHALENFDIISQLQQDTGADRQIIEADEFLILPNGNVQFTVTNGTAGNIDLHLQLSTSPLGNTQSGVIGSSSTGTIVLQSLEKPWIFPAIYLEQTPGGNKELVLPDTMEYNDATQEMTLTFTNNQAIARSFTIFYKVGSMRSNQICVDDASVSVSGNDDRPQISLWGLDHDEIYHGKTFREAWVNHIDSYKRPGEQRLISGLGGNLFVARTYDEAATQFLYPLLYTNLQSRSSADKVLGPLFWDPAETPGRSRGYITSSNSGTHWARVSAVAYNTGTGWTDYTIDLPSKLILDSAGSPTSLSSVISTTAGLEDYLTVENMGWSIHAGTYKIRAVADGVNQIVVSVENDNVTSSDFDDDGCGGEAGIFTDQFTWSADAPYVPGDLLISDAIEDSLICNVMSSSGAVTVSDGLTDLLEVPGGVLFVGQRTSSVIPLRSANPGSVADSSNVVRGDMLSYDSLKRLLRVLHVNSDSSRTITITAADGIATATLSSGDTSYLTSGMSVLLSQAGVYTGAVTILDVISDSEFTFSSEETDSTSGILVGHTIQVDEELEWSDSTGDNLYLQAVSRWIPIEAPDDSFDLTPDTIIRQFDANAYSAQPFLRSTTVVDNMYLTNYDDEVYKFDGTNLYRAGLFAWQPGLFITQETTGATIVADLRSVTTSAVDLGAGTATIALADMQAIPVGTSVRLTGSELTYAVRDYTEDGTDGYIVFDRALDASVTAGTASEIGIWRYYFRLNAVDANDNVIASATTGAQDHVVELTGNAAVQLKLVGLPAWDTYNYVRLECQIYRTKKNQAAPFYLETTLPMSFDNTTGYLQFRDSFADSDLTDLDTVTSALRGTELGTNWSDPLRAKYVTSAGNRLVLANIRDYPELDIQIVADGTVDNTVYAGNTLLFRRRNTDSASTTDMIARAKYEFVNGVTGTTSSFTIGADQFSFDVSGSAPVDPGDWIYLTYGTTATTGRSLDYSGWWQVASVAGSTVTVNLVGAAAAASYPDSYAIATLPADIPVLLGTDGNLGMVNGDSFDTFDAMRRMSLAINASMRQVDISLTGYETFTPWIVARGGNDLTPAGRLLVRQPRADDNTFELVPTFSGYELFVNSIRRSTGDQISATTRVFPSRLIFSYENYPEIFDNPTSTLDVESDSAVDVNSADGQEITGVIPFFGDAAFGAAQQSAILVVFKTNSIYLVDLNEKLAGRNAVQKLETEGLGCTAPYSIAPTRNGIMFANESGMYCLRRSQSIEYLGEYMERNWQGKVDLDDLSIAQGHHFGVGRVYKLSVPLTENLQSNGYIQNSDVYVYDHTGEAEGRRGAWTRYDNHPATGWANLAEDAYFGTTSGRVFSLRNTGELTDYRDDNLPIEFSIQLRPNDFGANGLRKVLDSLVVHYRNGSRSPATVVSFAVDTEQEYEVTQPFVVPKQKTGSGIDDHIGQDIQSIRHNVRRRRGVYFSIQIQNVEIDQSLEIAGISYNIAGLTPKGILQAAQTAGK